MFFPQVVKRASLAFFSRFHLGGLHSSGCLNGATIRVDDQNNILVTLDSSKGNPIELKVNDDLKRITIYGGKSSSSMGLAHVAIDGNTDGRWSSKSVTHT